MASLNIQRRLFLSILDFLETCQLLQKNQKKANPGVGNSRHLWLLLLSGSTVN